MQRLQNVIRYEHEPASRPDEKERRRKKIYKGHNQPPPHGIASPSPLLKSTIFVFWREREGEGERRGKGEGETGRSQSSTAAALVAVVVVAFIHNPQRFLDQQQIVLEQLSPVLDVANFLPCGPRVSCRPCFEGMGGSAP